MRPNSLNANAPRSIELAHFSSPTPPPAYEDVVSNDLHTRGAMYAVPVAPRPLPPRRSSQIVANTLSGMSRGLSKARLPIAVLLGAGITAGTTYALAHHVHNLITHAAVDPNPQTWINAARAQAYGPCYDGCDDCNDVNYAYNACAVTTRANVTGVICDGNAMWNWADTDRYPEACLQAVDAIYKQQALDNLKQKDRNQLAVIILTVLAGVIGAVVTCKIVGCIAARTGAAAQARRQRAQGVQP